METARSLGYVITRTVGSASSARGEPSPRTVSTKATRGILVSSLVLAALGTVAAASPGHVSSGHIRSGIALTSSCTAGSRPSMQTRPAIRGPWMYMTPAIRTGPWMYGIPAIRTGPWMYAIPGIRTGPWMYTVTIKKPRTCRAIAARSMT